MRVKRIDFNEDEDPATVHVAMSTTEAAMITLLIGKLNHHEMEDLMRGGGVVGSALCEGFAGAFFNRFYDGGVREYVEELP